MCPDLHDPINGRITYSSDYIAPFEVNTVATYSCDLGFGLDPNATFIRTCGLASNNPDTDPIGEWNETVATCQGRDKILPTVSMVARLFL